MAGTTKQWLAAGGLLALVLAGIGVAVVATAPEPPPPPPDPVVEFERQVHVLCSGCHAYPPPDSFPKADWKREVEQGYRFAVQAGRDPRRIPPQADVQAYYEARAPEHLPPPPIERATTPLPVRFELAGDGAGPQKFAVSNVSMVSLYGRPRPEVLVCDMKRNLVQVLRADETPPRWQTLATADHPAHAEVVDLDGDGVPDIL